MVAPFVGICYAYSGNAYHRTQWLCNVTGFAPSAAYEHGLPADVPNPESVIRCSGPEDLPDDCDLVVLSPRTARLVSPTIELPDFEHPQRALYFFGADTRFLSPEDYGRTPNAVVHVPTASDREADELYSFVVGAIVLADRQARAPWRS